ncbi:hypothetical protein R83H12_02457 [Fibrobacteria bacterium R8-3-H12]
MPKKLPYGQSNFANMIESGYAYVDKTYKDEVKAGGIVRSFYELLKAGTKSVVKRIFITGINPMMLNDLTSGFNMAIDLSLYPKYNDMFGFTREEVELLMQETGVDKNLIKVDMEAYYNGYMFNNNGKNKVYNSQMILYLFYQILQLGTQPQQIIDTNLQTDYERLRRLAENENNREKLLQIIQDGGIFGNMEDENINGYTDIYLQKHPAIPDIKFEYVFEVKYAKTGATKADIKAKFDEAEMQIEKYKKDSRFAGREDLKFVALVFKGKGEYEF